MGGFRSAVFPALLLAGALAACGGDGLESTVASARVRHPASRMVREMTGLSHLPIPADEKAFDASMRRHYPAALLEKRVRGAVLVDLDLDERGFVKDVVVVEPPASAGDVRMLIDDRDVRNGTLYREVVPSYDAEAFGAAARAAMREVRFEPALKDGRPVPFRMRMTITFAPPAS